MLKDISQPIYLMKHNQARRYARNIILPGIGKAGQEQLLNAKVLVIGAGGLGSPALLYLAASGIGLIGIVDDDKVDLSNLQRQIIHETSDVDRNKTDSAADSIYDLNPEIKIEKNTLRINEENAKNIIKNYDVVLDGSDNIETRFLVNEVCYKLNKTLITAAILGFSGQIMTVKKPHACYACLYPEKPPADSMPTCELNGVLGPLGGVMGSLMAAETIKEITGAGESLAGNMLIVDLLKNTFRKVKLNKEKKCKVCC